MNHLSAKTVSRLFFAATVGVKAEGLNLDQVDKDSGSASSVMGEEEGLQ